MEQLRTKFAKTLQEWKDQIDPKKRLYDECMRWALIIKTFFVFKSFLWLNFCRIGFVSIVNQYKRFQKIALDEFFGRAFYYVYC